MELRLATLCGLRALVVDLFRVVLVFGLFVGLGALSLRPLVMPVWRRLGLGAGRSLGTGLGELALHGVVLWLGTLAASRSLRSRARLLSQHFVRECGL